VKNGQTLVKLMSEAGVPPRAALWVHTPDTDIWRLWIVPHKTINDKREFYLSLSQLIAKHPKDLESFDASDAELVSADHPAIKGLSKLMRVEGINSVHMSNNLLDGYYLPDGIVIRLAL